MFLFVAFLLVLCYFFLSLLFFSSIYVNSFDIIEALILRFRLHNITTTREKKKKQK